MTKSNTYLDRIKKLEEKLILEKIDSLLIENPIDLLYFTGLHLSCGRLYVKKEKSILLVDGRYFEVATHQSPLPVQLLTEANQIPFLEGIKRLAFDGDCLSYTPFMKLRALCRSVSCKMVSRPDLVQSLRQIKTPAEIELMRKSAELGYKAYLHLLKKVKIGITEIALAKEFEIYCLKEGADRLSFSPIIAFGKHTALPHYHPGETPLKKNDLVLFDVGVVLNSYCSDMTRTLFMGKPDPVLKRLYEVNRLAQKSALALCKPGTPIKALDEAAREEMRAAGLEEYFIHKLGHGVGLQIHESPRIGSDTVDRNLKLEPGMVITIEPGLYLPGKGGVRYEDTVVITQSGYTNFYPET